MRSFDDFATAAPVIADRFRERLDATGLCFIGTLRSDGSPRVSPVEALIHEGTLYLGMMPRSVKARDLQRDGRISVITSLADKQDLWGEVKLQGAARELSGDERRVLDRALRDEGTVDPDELGDYHGFEVLVGSAAWQRVADDTWVTVSWRDGEAMRARRRGADDQTVEVPLASVTASAAGAGAR
jgi:hypothetical protein